MYRRGRTTPEKQKTKRKDQKDPHDKLAFATVGSFVTRKHAHSLLESLGTVKGTDGIDCSIDREHERRMHCPLRTRFWSAHSLHQDVHVHSRF